jgi:hypothetical protein
MPCKIERLMNGERCVVLRVSGRIRAEDVETLRDLLGQEKGRVAIDLKDVLLVAREAVTLLEASEASGTELRNCPSYIREWVDRERARAGVGPTDLETGARDDATQDG